MMRGVLLIIVFISANEVRSQAHVLAQSVTYQMGIPISDLKTYTDITSFRGITVDARYFITNDVTIGFSLGWQMFFDEIDGTIQFDGGALTAKQTRNANTFPVMLKTFYHFGREQGIRPFIGLGAGIMGSLQLTDVGLFRIENRNIHFALGPEIGVFIPFNSDGGINLSIDYNYGAASSDSFNYTYFGIKLGGVWFE